MTETEQISPPIETPSRQELEQQLESALQTIDRLQQIRESMGEFFRVLLNYEIGTPLLSILGYSDFLLAENGRIDLTEEQQKKFVAVIRKNAKVLLRVRMLAIDLINLDANIAGFRDSLPAKEADSKVVINNVIDWFEEIDLVVNLPDNLPKAQIPENALGYILISALTTLRSVGLPNQITMDVGVEDEWIVIKVANANLNISRHPLPTNFDSNDSTLPLFSLYHPESWHYLLSLYGGQMRLEAQEGTGVIVTFNLPIHRGAPTG